MRVLPISLIPMLLTSLPARASEEGYLRYPDIHGEQVVFTAEDDLWIADISRQPATARRLTRDEGSERHGKFSPDGKWIAFTADYDGNSEVFVVPAEGGEPRRLTWHPSGDEAVDWTEEGQVIFRSRRGSPHRSWELYTVSPEGGEPALLPLGWASRLSVDPDTGMWAFTRTAWETATWKRYRGGTAQEIWVGNPERGDFRELTDFDGTDAFPMWHDGRIWFSSDRGGTMNLWSCTREGKLCKQHTDHGQWDVRWPSMAQDGRVVYMLAGDIQIFDPSKGASRKLLIELPSDRDLTRPRNPDPGSYLTWFSLSPDGDRLLYVTRGETFSVPVEDGVTLPIEPGSGARESWASFSPDGERVAYVTDESGEEAVVTADAWGRGEVGTVQPPGERGWHFPPRWSPDGERLAWSDDNQDLWISEVKGGTPRKIEHAERGEIRDYTWSPDGRWLAYTLYNEADFGTLWLYDTREDARHPLTSGTTSDNTPTWDPKGRYLYFFGERHINPLLGSRDFDYIVAETTRIYAFLLKADEENPLLKAAGVPPTEESRKEKREEKKEAAEEAKEEAGEKLPDVQIDLEGLSERVIELPVEPGSYAGMSATEGKVFFMRYPLTGMAEWGGGDGPQTALMAFDWEEEETSVFAEGIASYDLARGGSKIALMRGASDLSVVDAGSPPGPDGMEKGKIDLTGVVIHLDPREEWRQIYFEAWRHMRDFFWDQGMSGVDWAALRDQYAALLPRLATRDDLDDLMGELIGELATSHTYVWGGDYHRYAEGASIGLLGADLVPEGDAWRVARIYRGDPADGVRSPLSVPGVGLQEGDYILAVNNQPAETDRPYTASLVGMAGRPVMLTVNSTPSEEGARQVVVTPMGDEGGLRYADWVRQNREYVAEKTGGKIGYIHIPDMGARGLIEFDKWFYPQIASEGMVVDARWNGGGFVSQLIVERLMRDVIFFDRSKAGVVYTYPARVLNGPLVVLTNEFAGSDGDIFPQAMKETGLAPVIGMRSWGGVVGIRGDKQMTDGGGLTQPEYAFWMPGVGWGIENHGVDPDIEVQNMPQDLARGVDAQLDRAIQEVLARREAHPPVTPEFTPSIDKSRDAFQEELK